MTKIVVSGITNTKLVSLNPATMEDEKLKWTKMTMFQGRPLSLNNKRPENFWLGCTDSCKRRGKKYDGDHRIGGDTDHHHETISVLQLRAAVVLVVRMKWIVGLNVKQLLLKSMKSSTWIRRHRIHREQLHSPRHMTVKLLLLLPWVGSDQIGLCYHAR